MTHSVNLRAECRLRWKSRKQSFVAGDVSPEAGSLCRLVPQLNVLPLHLVSGAQRGVVHLVDAELYLLPERSLDVPANLHASYLIQGRPMIEKFISSLLASIFGGLKYTLWGIHSVPMFCKAFLTCFTGCWTDTAAIVQPNL